MTGHHIGQILIERELLDHEAVQQVIEQQALDRRPFARIVADWFGIEETEVYQIVAEEMAQDLVEVNPAQEALDPEARRMLSAREAWEHLMLPLRFENDVLLCATTPETLPGALRVAQQNFDQPFRLLLSPVRSLEQIISECYDYNGVEINE
jgi:hypothetical protein